MTALVPDPGPDDRAVLRLRPAVRRRRRAGAARHARRGPAARPGARRRRRAGAGRPARALAGRRRTGPSSARRARCTATAGPSPAGAAPRPTTPATTRSPPATRRRRRAPRRSSRSRSSRAGCSTGSSPAPTCPATTDALAADPLLAALAGGPPRDAGRRPDEHGFALRRTPAGRGRDRLPRPTRGTGPMTRRCSGPATSAPATCFTDGALLARWSRVEQAWLAAWSAAGHRAGRRRADLAGLVDARTSPPGRAAPRPAATRSSRSSRCCASGGRPPTRATGCTAGLTSQDVLDTALMLVQPRRPGGSRRAPRAGRRAGRAGRRHRTT